MDTPPLAGGGGEDVFLTYDRSVIEAPRRPVGSVAYPPAISAGVRLERLPDLDGLAPMDAAEGFRSLPGLALLESARPGRRARWSYLTADPVAVIERPDPRGDPFATARRLLSRMKAQSLPNPSTDLPPFVGGFVGFLGYDLGRRFERLPAGADDDQHLPEMRLALHDWVIAWDRRTGAAWLGGRAVDGQAARLNGRLEEVRSRLRSPSSVPGARSRQETPTQFRSSMDRPGYKARVEEIRRAIERGDIYQANLSRRLEAPFSGDPWLVYRLLRTGDPALYAAYLDIGPGGNGGGPQAIVSASPEPFLATDAAGTVLTDPIKGTRPRGRAREEDRALACELLASAKDRAENVMIVDVLRNDLGRVSVPGTVSVPRLCRLERTAAVQHLVSTVVGRMAPPRGPFDLLAAAFPGGSITGAPKIRAMEILAELETVRRGPYTGALGWIGPDGAMASSILIRTLVADGRRLSLNVGGGITWRSDPAAEWDETVAKARGPLGAIGAAEA